MVLFTTCVFSGLCGGTTKNAILSAPQKELLHWHWTLGIIMSCIQEMMREQHYVEPNGNKMFLHAIIKSNFTLLEIVLFLLVICVLPHARTSTPNVLWMWLIKDCEGAITMDQYKVGDFVSVGKWECPSVTSRPVVNLSVVITRSPEDLSGEPRSIRLQ